MAMKSPQEVRRKWIRNRVRNIRQELKLTFEYRLQAPTTEDGHWIVNLNPKEIYMNPGLIKSIENVSFYFKRNFKVSLLFV